MDELHPIRNMNVTGYSGIEGYIQVQVLRPGHEEGGPIQLEARDGEDTAFVNLTADEALNLIRFLAQCVSAVRQRDNDDI